MVDVTNPVADWNTLGVSVGIGGIGMVLIFMIDMIIATITTIIMSKIMRRGVKAFFDVLHVSHFYCPDYI